MDVRQFAFLVRQPSAALKSRSHFLGMPKRGLAFILANAMFWQPLLVQAEGIAVSGQGTTLGQAGNGVPIVNIAALRMTCAAVPRTPNWAASSSATPTSRVRPRRSSSTKSMAPTPANCAATPKWPGSRPM